MYRVFGVMIAFAVLTGCAYDQAVNNLSPDEQNAFRAYRKVIKSSQARTYLAKPSATERSAYLREIGAQQRFDAPNPQDRESVLNGYIRKGMSAEALRFLWGSPIDTEGTFGKAEYWIYRGQYNDLLVRGNQFIDATRVRVLLVDGRVKWWFQDEFEIHEDAGENGVKRRF